MEQTKLSVFCDKFLEAGWLLAAIMAPLFFDVYSSRVFEPDKITLVRSLAVVMSAAWLIRVLETGFRPRSDAAAGGDQASAEPWYRRLAQTNPLAYPVLFLVTAYLIATVVSVSQVVSIWGSYQRLQGTYSTFSYIVIAALVMTTMRRREQVERLISIMLFTSLPASLYGLVQHNRLEFLPWAGDVTTRVTSSMGNAIFIAAWLIMVVPLALGRYLDSLLQLWNEPTARRDEPAALGGHGWSLLATVQGAGLFAVVLLGLEFYAASQKLVDPPGPLQGALLAVSLGTFIVPLFLGIGRRWHLTLSVCGYTFLMLCQLLTIFYSGSRGPWLGLIAGLVFFALLIAIVRRMRRIVYATLAFAFLVLAFLGIFNMPNTPLEALKQVPTVGRLGNFLELEGGTGKVRVLIWEGALQLIKSDPLHTLVGWGPESMYVAYNRFYPPDLAHYEARNASPDRSHNETYDSLVITGIVGFFAYWAVFYTFFYFVLKLLGLVQPGHGRILYPVLIGVGALALVLLYAQVLPLPLSPILPLMGIVGVGLYLVVTFIIQVLASRPGRPAAVELAQGVAIAINPLSVFSYLFYFARDFLNRPPSNRHQAVDEVLLVAFFAAVLAHFIEIQFGIAIASSRTYFWLYLALAFVISRLIQGETVPARPGAGESVAAAATTPVAVPVAAAATVRAPSRRPKQRRPGAAREAAVSSSLAGGAANWWPAVVYALMAAAVLVTMVFDFVVPQQQGTPVVVLSLIFGTWLFVSVIGMVLLRGGKAGGGEQALQGFLVSSLVTWVIVVTFALLHPLRWPTASGVMEPSQFITYFYIWAGVLMIALTIALFLSERELPLPRWQGIAVGWAYPFLVAAAVVVVSATNLNVVIADIHYKTGDAYDKAGRWEGSIPAYQRALNLAPSQDFYYLFLGRAFMELAKRVPDAQRPPVVYVVNDLLTMKSDALQKMSRQDMLSASLTALTEARRLNPLNTDHTANLGRLYRFWGEAVDPKYLQTSLDYYRQALEISPNTAHLYDEWSQVYFVMGQYQACLDKLLKSLSLDSQFVPTYVYLGDTYQAMNQPQAALAAHIAAIKLEAGALINPSYFTRQDPRSFDARLGFYEQAGLLEPIANAYKDLIAKDTNSFAAHYSLGYIRFIQATTDPARLEDSLAELQQAERLNKDDIATHSILGYIYAQQNRNAEALQQNLEVVRLSPNDVNSHRNLAILYQRLGMVTQAISEVQTAIKLAPTDASLQEMLKQLQPQPIGPVAPPVPQVTPTPTPRR